MITSNTALYRVKEHSLSLLFIISISVVFFTAINFQLLSAGFYSHINIAFDFDQAWFFDIVAYPSDQWQHKVAQDVPPLSIKHPFLYLYRLPCEALQFIGFAPEVSVLFLSLMFHTGTLVVSYFIFLNILSSSHRATLLTVFMMLSSTYIVNGIVLDTYVLAGFWIACCFALYIKALTTKSLDVSWLKIMVYAMTVGTTTYLLLLVILLEISLVWSNKKYLNKEKLSYLTSGVIRFLSLFLVIFCFCYYQSILEMLSNPIDVLKRALWAVARPGEKEGIVSIMGTFLVHTFIAPFHSIIEIEKDIYMADFRNGGFHPFAYIVILPLIASYLLAFKNRGNLLFVSVSWLIITMLFHVEYQDRGSLFLYTGHTMLASSILLALGLKNVNFKIGWIISGIFLVILAYNNLQSIYFAIKSIFFS